MHIKCVHELYSMVPQHQFVRKMRHLSRDGGQAVRVRDFHRAGAHDQQHRYVRADERDLQLLHGRLHHRHGSCAVFCEDLTAEERMRIFDVIYIYKFVIPLLSMLLSMLMKSLQCLLRMMMKKMTIGRLGLDFLKKVEAPAP